jgi:chromosome segregation ATPase
MNKIKKAGLAGLAVLSLSAFGKTDVKAGLQQLKTNETNAKANQKQYDENSDIASKNIVEVTAAIKTLREQRAQLSSNAVNLEKNRAVLTKMEEKLKAFSKTEDVEMKREAAQIAQLRATLEKLEANQKLRQANIDAYQAKIAEVEKEKSDWDQQKQAFTAIQQELDSKEKVAMQERTKWLDKRKGYRSEGDKWKKAAEVAEQHRVKFDRLAK